MKAVENKVEHISYEHYLFRKQFNHGFNDAEYWVDKPEYGEECIQDEDAYLFSEEELSDIWIACGCDHDYKKIDWENHKKESVKNVN